MNHKAKIIPNIVLPGILTISGVAGIIAIATATTTSALTYSSDTDISFTFNPTLSISLSDTNINIDNLLPGLSSESSPITVHVNSNTPYGYSLFASVGNSTDYNTTSLVHSSNDNSNNNSSNDNNNSNNNSIPATFTSIATNASLPQLDTDNTWGYSFSNDNGTTWSNYNGLPLYSTVGNNTSTNNPALLIDTKNPADSTESIDFKIAAKASTTQASGTYNNVINFYAVGKPAPLTLYEEVAKMSKGTQTLADLQTTITAPTTTDYHEDTSNSGVYEYNSAVFGESSDASNANKIYYYRGVLEPESDQGEYGSDGKATTYPNYVRLSNDTCWRIVRTTGSGGIKMVYNGTWTGSTCANSTANAQTTTQTFASKGTSSQSSANWKKNIHYVGYTFNNSMTDRTNSSFIDTVFGGDADPSLNNTRSKIKTYIEDTWFANSMISYTDILESAAGYCNDRTAYSDPDTSIALTTISPYKTSNAYMYFGAYGRSNTNTKKTGKTPSLTCPRSTVDLYSYVAGSTGVANELKYPAALLTADEASFAGSGSGVPPQGVSSNTHSFLRSGTEFWLLSPSFRNSIGDASELFLAPGGTLVFGSSINAWYGVRPAISLKPGTTVASGTGIATDPWIINE